MLCRRHLLQLACGAVLGAAALAGTAAEALDIRGRRIVLLGEVHDNAAQHALRLQAFKTLLATGARPALLLEQLDRERQPAIDTLLTRADAGDADGLLRAAQMPAGWNPAFYRPFVQLAIDHRLPIVAANVSRADAQRIVGQGLAASGFDGAVPADIQAAQAAAIERSHCGMVDAATAARMAGAQIARDQFMARLVQQHAARGVVLLAGNGHVRRDVGVPRWLPPELRAQTLAVGLLETGAGELEAGAFDLTAMTPPQPRTDPCAGMQRPAAALR